jgi:hypothetical protein
MIINNKLIKKLKPCKDRFNNYLIFYKDKSHTPAQFMGLKNITQSDKLWVAFRLIPKDSIRLAVADMAESVLHIFESKYPNDLRPRKAIEAARLGDKDAAYAAAHAYSAYVATNDADYDAYSVHAATVAYAAHVAAAYVEAYDAYDAAFSAAVSISNGLDQEKLIRKICLKYLK